MEVLKSAADHEVSMTLPLMCDDQKQEQYGYGSGGKHESYYNHRPKTSNTSFVKTVFNGAGLLSIPYALSSGGWLSLILLLVIALAAFYSGLLIKRCMDLDSSNIKTYPDIGHCAFGRKGRTLVSIFMYIEQYLVPTGFLILGGDNLNNLFPGIKLEIMSGLITINGVQLSILIVALVILPTVWFDNLSILSYVSASGVIASGIIFGSIMWAGAFDGIGFHIEEGVVFNWKGIPTAVSLYAFCYSAHPVFPTLYTSMKNKNQFSNVLVLCFIICTSTYALMAVVGYLMFGSKVQSQITLNLPTMKLSSKVATYTTLITPIAKYAINIRPIVDEVQSCLPNNLNTKFSGMIVGTIILISNVVIALTIPFFASLMALVGAFVSVTGSITLPCLCYLKISGTYKRFGWELVILVAIMVMGFVVAISGSYTSLLDIIGNLQL
ncbi:Amino acid transporter, transmembrane domain containing protein [Parasponia andersonii]|uniref:Amino acid transporter, transmembrane domain containing protein n=1 Tax=Parasponia andersonii TaxID=3476 RepID=A0A2P5CWJ5_PARAD|nr:Amino acid transporter, transmembrane domain containing protein [Parasponia andersonii]